MGLKVAMCVLALTVAISPAVADAKSGGPGLIVVPTPASGPPLSYFKLTVGRGQLADAGTITLRNAGDHALRVALDPVAGETIDTLGSAYAPPGRPPGGAARWLRLGARQITLAPGATTAVPVAIIAPRGTRSGDYLAGVSVEALGQEARSVKRHGVAIASVVRYAIGVEATLPGPRHASIDFTGARLQREPAGLTFLLHARNRGNVILQHVFGQALITRDQRVVAKVPLGPGTFVTGTSIDYPILTPGERTHAGATYRVRAYLRYAGGIARLDTLVGFGHQAALRQQAYGGPRADASSGPRAWLIALLAALGAALAIGPLIVLRRRRGVRSPLRTLESALAASRANDRPLSLIVVQAAGNGAIRGLAPALRSRLRHADSMCWIGADRLLVVAPDTDSNTAGVLAGDMRQHVERAHGSTVAVDVHVPDGGVSGHELLERVRAGARGAAARSQTIG